jgi:hypothetical protein
MRLSTVTRHLVFLALMGAGIALMATGSACKAHAQARDAVLEDLVFQVLDGTTGQPTEVERVTIAYLGMRQQPVLDVQPSGSTIELGEVPLRERSQYVVTLWKDGVPYFFQRTGRALRDEEQVLHVFSTTAQRTDVRITGLNLVVRREDTVVSLEYMLQVDNTARPQATLVDDPGAFLLRLPAGVREVEAQFFRGPDPVDVPVTESGRGRWYLDLGVVPGNNRIQLKALVPWREGLEVPVGSDLPIDAWSVLATPEWLEIDNNELEPDPDMATEGLKRMVGRALDADRDFSFVLRGGEVRAGATEDIFATEAPAPDEAEPEEDDGTSWLPVIGAAVLGIAVIVVLARRRR